MIVETFLLYVSQAPDSNVGVVFDHLQEKLIEHAPLEEITGILIYRSGYFMQYLEGHELSVSNLFSTIRGTVNHRNVRVLSRGSLLRRRFKNWSFKVVSLKGPNPSSESLIELFETVLSIKSSSESEIDAILNRFCRDSSGGAHENRFLHL